MTSPRKSGLNRSVIYDLQDTHIGGANIRPPDCVGRRRSDTTVEWSRHYPRKETASRTATDGICGRRTTTPPGSKCRTSPDECGTPALQAATGTPAHDPRESTAYRDTAEGQHTETATHPDSIDWASHRGGQLRSF